MELINWAWVFGPVAYLLGYFAFAFSTRFWVAKYEKEEMLVCGFFFWWMVIPVVAFIGLAKFLAGVEND